MKNGNNLIGLGFKPNRYFKIALEYINANNLSEEDIVIYCNSLFPKEVLPLSEPKPYKIFMSSKTEEEVSNYKAVIETMNEVMKTPVVVDGAVMPDACPSGSVGHIPVGGVVVTDNCVIPNMHSADICCSLMATFFETDKSLDEVLRVAKEVTHFGYGSNLNFVYDLPIELFDRISKNNITKDFMESALRAIGTQGDGNHFLSVGTLRYDEMPCIVTHHGSRSFGANVFKKGLKIAEKFRRELSPKTNSINAWIPLDTQEGAEYWGALQIVREWTKVNHEVIHNEIIKRLKAKTTHSFWNEHNFVFKKDNLVYHAKGATPLTEEFTPDNKTGLRIIPMNMSDDILLVTANPNNVLGFAPHGAGRNVSRTQFKKEASVDELDESIKNVKFTPYSGVTDYSEYPLAYKNSKQVEEDIVKFNLANIVGRIKPFGCIMAGEVEPFWKKKE